MLPCVFNLLFLTKREARPPIINKNGLPDSARNHRFRSHSLILSKISLMYLLPSPSTSVLANPQPTLPDQPHIPEAMRNEGRRYHHTILLIHLKAFLAFVVPLG